LKDQKEVSELYKKERPVQKAGKALLVLAYQPVAGSKTC
jgi:hypothetical protein